VLSLAKLAGVDQRYYLEQAERRVDHAESVSTGAEDYYLSGPEAAGHWTGSAAKVLRLSGEVTESGLRAILSKHDPVTGKELEGSVQRARVPGFDLMFSVPKSASILFGIGDEATQRAILDAQAEGVRSALEYLEKQACRTRKGQGGYEIVPGQGFVGAAFRHRTSRAGDPQIHTHVLVANATRIHDGTWGSLDGRAIYAEARTAGFIHEAVFRHELRQRLGVEWTEARNGISEIEGVPRDAIDAFSQRKAEIDAQLKLWGTDTAAARQSAAVQTRRRKDYDVTPEKLAPEWRARAEALGLDADRVRQIVHRPHRDAEREAPQEVARRLLSEEGLTAQRASFDRRDAIRATAEAARIGMTRSDIEAFVDELLTEEEVVKLEEPGGQPKSHDVIRLRDGRLVSAALEAPRYSTLELLAVEQRVLDQASAVKGAGAGMAEPGAVEAALAIRPTIGDDQKVMVERLCLGGSGVQVVVGPPGTGKTFALAAAREAWETSGLKVYGAAVARRAAVELTSSAGIEATSVTALLGDLRRVNGDLLDDRTVIVVDEAAMMGTRPLAELCERTIAAGAKLVLVGDHAQLPEIDAGGAFRSLVERVEPIVLTVNRRQDRASDRRLLDLWRAGELDEALTVATEAGELVLDLTPEETFARMVTDYCSSLDAGDDAVMLAPRRAEVRHLNDLAREVLSQRGQLGGSSMTVGDHTFAVGDLVVLRLNDRGLNVQNGTRGRVVEVDADAMVMRIALPDGTSRELPSRYLNLRSRSGVPAVQHGYAMTAHLAQGMTTDRTFVLGSETVYREWGYVAWSRARHGTRFYVVEAEVSDEHHTAAAPSDDRFAETLRRLSRSEAQECGIHSRKPQSEEIARASAAKHNRVGYLETALGPRPDTFRRRRRWDRAVRRVERFRSRNAVADAHEALGPRPDERMGAVEWDRAQRYLTKARLGLGLSRTDAGGHHRQIEL
jgi:conjugative relaxase-like TrwC/TraI family protein